MSSRYIAWLAIGVAGAFLIVASDAFTSLATIAWLAFAISIGTLLVSAGIAYRYRNHVPTLVTSIVTAVVSAWTIVASLVFSLPVVQNLAFAGSLALAGLALAGLTIHELSSERVTHSLEVTDNQRDHHFAAAA
jgi:drug/metabolite transporter (DMT)-like permease